MLASQANTRSARCVKSFAVRPSVAAPKRVRRTVTTHASAEQPASTRRDVLGLVGAGLLSAAVPSSALALDTSNFNVTTITVNNLSTFQRIDQRKEYRRRAEVILGKYLTSADAPATLRLVLNDAATYDADNKVGGFDGSIALSDELDRPANKPLKPLVEKLAAAKKEIDAESEAARQSAISWADLIYLAGKVTHTALWRDIKLSRSSNAANASLIANNFATEWPATLGRLDSDAAGPAVKIPSADAPVDEIKAFLLSVGAKAGDKPGPLTPKPILWERPGFVIWTAASADPAAEEKRFVEEDPAAFAGFKKKYDTSRNTVTRTDYEVDFVNYYNKLTSLGAKFNPDAYLRDELIYTPKKF